MATKKAFVSLAFVSEGMTRLDVLKHCPCDICGARPGQECDFPTGFQGEYPILHWARVLKHKRGLGERTPGFRHLVINNLADYLMGRGFPRAEARHRATLIIDGLDKWDVQPRTDQGPVSDLHRPIDT